MLLLLKLKKCDILLLLLLLSQKARQKPIIRRKKRKGSLVKAGSSIHYNLNFPSVVDCKVITNSSPLCVHAFQTNF